MRTPNCLIDSLDQIEDLDPLLQQHIAPLFSSRTGIINSILERKELSAYGLKMFQALSCNSAVVFGNSKEVSSGGLGIGSTNSLAIASCFAESIERYCMSYTAESEIYHSEWKNLNNKYRITNYSLYSARQYKGQKRFVAPHLGLQPWVKLQSLFSKRNQIYWPASLIYIPFEQGSKVAECTSTGVAAHTRKNEAIISGLLEAIERDALMITFLNRLPATTIDPDSVPKNDPVAPLLSKIRRSYKLKIYQLVTDLTEVAYAAIIWRQNKTGIHYGIGACAGLDSSAAIAKALTESLFTYFYSHHIIDLTQPVKNKIRALYEHFLYFQGDRFSQLLLPEGRAVQYRRTQLKIDSIFKSLKKAKLTPYSIELTTPDVAKYGWHVVRIVVPGLIDLNPSHQLIREDASRLRNVPLKFNSTGIRNLYRTPHPFP